MQKINYPLILSDFDGTLLRSDERIADDTVAIINRYVAAGGHFVLCTGRTLPSILLQVKKLRLKGLVSSYQGSVIADIDSGKVLLDGEMDKDGAVEILRYCEQLGLHVHVYGLNDYFVNMSDEWLTLYERISGVKGCLVTDRPLSKFVQDKEMQVKKMVVMIDPEKRQAVLERLSERFGEKYYVTYSTSFLIEISSKRYSKATALKFIADYYKIPQERTIAVGDSLNDLPMIEAAGKGIAVQNADPLLKNAAGEVCAFTNDENAVGTIIEKYGFTEE